MGAFKRVSLISIFSFLSLINISVASSDLKEKESTESQPNLPSTVIRDLRLTDDTIKAVQYQSGEVAFEYDDLTFISIIDCYKGREKKLTDTTSLSSKDLFIPRTIAENGECKVLEASEGSIEHKSLLKGIERRGRIKDPQTQEWPYRIHGHMIMKFLHDTYTGTGILIGPNHVLTAGHNLFKDGRWATEVFFTPGRDQDDYPYGDSKGCVLLVHEKWQKNDKKKDDYDFGMVILDASIGNIIGWSGLLSLPDVLLKEWPVSITGYPGEKGSGNYYSTQMWGMRETITNITPEKLFYKIETSEGQSGSGICGAQWPEYEGFYTVGIHTGQEKEDASENRGVRLTKDKFKLIIEWLKAYQLEPFPSLVKNKLQTSLFLLPLDFLDEISRDYESLSRRARASEAKALQYIGTLYFEGKNIPRDYSKAFTCFYLAASAGYAPALISLGFCYEKGRGVELSLLKMISLYQRAANQKNAEASRRLGLLFLRGKGIFKNVQSAIKHFEDAMNGGDGEACHHLAQIYEEGTHVTPNKEKVERLKRQAKEWGYNYNHYIMREEKEDKSYLEECKILYKSNDKSQQEKGRLALYSILRDQDNYYSSNAAEFLYLNNNNEEDKIIGRIRLLSCARHISMGGVHMAAFLFKNDDDEKTKVIVRSILYSILREPERYYVADYNEVYTDHLALKLDTAVMLIEKGNEEDKSMGNWAIEDAYRRAFDLEKSRRLRSLQMISGRVGGHLKGFEAYEYLLSCKDEDYEYRARISLEAIAKKAGHPYQSKASSLLSLKYGYGFCIII